MRTQIVWELKRGIEVHASTAIFCPKMYLRDISIFEIFRERDNHTWNVKKNRSLKVSPKILLCHFSGKKN